MLANHFLTNQTIQITLLFWRNKYIEKKKLNHLSKKNNSTSYNKISNVKANIKSAQFELMTDRKSTKNKTKKSNTENVQHEKKKLWHTSIQSNLHHYKKMLPMHLLKKTLTIVKIIHRLSAAISFQKVRNNFKKSVIFDDSMLKHWNCWKMSKKVKSDSKILVKHFSGAKQIPWRITWNCIYEKTRII